MSTMTPEPALSVSMPQDGDVRAVALVMHGGRVRGHGRVRPTQLAVLRMSPFATSLARAGHPHGLAVARLRYVVRGWNGDARSPVADVEWAIATLAAQFGAAPIALIGHSMGGRAAIYTAAHPAVQGIVGLAPWIEKGDPYEQVAGKNVLVVHGDGDRITNPRESAAWTQRAATVAASAAYVAIQGSRHALLQRAGLWHSLTTAYVLAVLCDVPPAETDGSVAANVVTQVLAGHASLVV